MVVQAPLALELQLLCDTLEFSLELQVRVLPREPVCPSLSLESLPTLEFQLLHQRPAFLAQQLEALVLVAQQLEPVLSQPFGAARTPQGSQGGN
jgi:hypothetical protein